MPYYGPGLTDRSLNRSLGTFTSRARWTVVDGGRMRMLTRVENVASIGFPVRDLVPENAALALHILDNANPPSLAQHAIEQLRKAA